MKCTVKNIVDFYKEYPEAIGQINVKTKHGFKKIEYADLTAKSSEVFELMTTSGKKILTSPNHRLKINNEWTEVQNSKPGDIIDVWENELLTKSTIDYIFKREETRDLYDLQVDGHEFIANGIISHNSSILEAVYFGFFGKPFRKVSINELINNVTNKQLKVELSFKINSDLFTIIRGLKPSRFEIYKNNELIVQDAKSLDYQKMLEEKILKTTPDVFKQLVLLGANVPTSKNFSELTNKEREELFKYIIDIGIFTEFSELAKTKLKELKTELSTTESKAEQLFSLKNKLNADIQRQEKQNETHEEDKRSKTQELLTEQEKYNGTISQIEKVLETLTTPEDTITPLISEAQKERNNFKIELEQNKSQISLIEKLKSSHDVCIGCEKLQTISGIDLTAEESYRNKKNILDTLIYNKEEEIKKLQEEYKQYEEKRQKFEQISNIYLNAKNQIKQIQDKIALLESIQMNTIDYSTVKEIEAQEQDLINLKIKIEEKIIDYLSFHDLVSDKNLKGQILDMSLPIINKWINYFLEKFGNFPFLFTINNDLSESIITMDGTNLEKSFNSLSNGQKLRIVFSILFAFLKFSEERNTTHFNILFLDEVLDSSLDTDGRMELINILRMEFTERSINIVSHNSEIKEAEEMFENIYEVQSTENGSKLLSYKDIRYV